MLHHVFEPSVVLDVSPVWERRRRFLEIYASQVSGGADASPTAINDGQFAAMLTARATSFGAMVGVDYGEPFYVDGPLLVRSYSGLEERAAGRHLDTRPTSDDRTVPTDMPIRSLTRLGGTSIIPPRAVGRSSDGRRPRDTVKVGFVQINTALDSSLYLPYSVALLQAYLQEHAERPERYTFGIPIIQRLTPGAAAAALGDADIVGFSMYVWNANRSLAIARELKAARSGDAHRLRRPARPGPRRGVPARAPVHRRRLSRRGRADVLRDRRALSGPDWEDVAGVSFIDGSGRFVAVPRRPRIADLSIVPSPFLEGVFAPLMESLPDTTWRTVWETNRGCPFKCTFCDWGSAIAAKVQPVRARPHHAEAEWIAANRIDYVFIGDANFGILPRDVEIAETIVAAAKRHGYPKQVLVQQTKNATERAYLTMKTIADAGPRDRAEHLDPDDHAGGARGDQAQEHLARDLCGAPAAVRARRDPDVRRHDRRPPSRDAPVVQGERLARRRARTASPGPVPQPVDPSECRDGRPGLPGAVRVEDGHVARSSTTTRPPTRLPTGSTRRRSS